ncbi:hypothetical protein SASPL_126779 [Salvia splendens]|uniref:Polygalacturonase n=1 Tax=Salvia splendens TaxID=180675 RepID=A0A8X8ZQC4_SALSN|nr:hypothetical protein SASPL_126779 [Salvia splendens]
MRPTTSYVVTTFLIILICSSSSCLAKKHSHHHKTKHDKKPAPPTARKQVLDVEDYGAKADGKSDNSQAFKKAWDKACNSLESIKILVPKGKVYYVKHVDFTGPCYSGISMEIQGTIKSFAKMYDTPKRLWIKFEDVRNMEVFGGGTIDGSGEVWWKNSCKIKKTKALTFRNCSNLTLSNLRLLNAQQMHVIFQDCNDVEASKLVVEAPEHSPNTDGIHITRTSNIKILDSQIRTGDDCVSIVNGSRNVDIRNIACGPGHGISIGSLGEDNTENYVSNVFVKGATFTGTTNGARIKTWQKSAVQVENVVYRNIRGTSASKVAINLNCSESVPCKNVVLQNVMLTAQQKGEKVEASCNHLATQTTKLNSLPSCSLNN